VESLVDKPLIEQAPPAQLLPDLASEELTALYQAHHREIFFLKAFTKWKDFRGDSSCRAWLYRIAINHCSNLRQTWHNRHIFPAEEDFVEDNAPANTDSPLRVLEIKELGDRIQKTLDGLPEEYRLLLLLVADQELSYDEVAALTGQTPDAVRGKLHRARKAFTAQFQKTA
jgi:RNA polymerase sigma-70 factor (ECF subfamily)